MLRAAFGVTRGRPPDPAIGGASGLAHHHGAPVGTVHRGSVEEQEVPFAHRLCFRAMRSRRWPRTRRGPWVEAMNARGWCQQRGGEGYPRYGGAPQAYPARPAPRSSAGRRQAMSDLDTYRIIWSTEDAEYVALCLEFPLLRWLAPRPEEAFAGIRRAVADVARDMQSAGGLSRGRWQPTRRRGCPVRTPPARAPGQCPRARTRCARGGRAPPRMSRASPTPARPRS